MSQWLSNALQRAEGIDDWLRPQRRASLEILKGTPWPSRKTEDWKYTSLFPLVDREFDYTPSGDSEGVEAIDGFNSIDLVFVDGVLTTTLSDLPVPSGVAFYPLADSSQGWIADSFAAVKPQRHLFGLVNDALATGGVVIDIAEGVSVDRPIRIVNRITRGREAHMRVILRMGRGASASVLEQLVGSEESFLTTVAEFDIGESATLQHYRLALQGGDALSIGGDYFSLGQSAHLNSTVVGFGSKLTRVNVDVQYGGENASAELNAIYLLNGRELFDLHSNIEHAVAHCNTQEKVRGIVAGSSRAVFNGRIHIHRHAQKTVAELNNLNLLMSRDAEIDTKPELEIYADDVRCAHGATVAEIDKRSLYYLQSRGISRVDAQVMLSFGFINETVNEMPSEALADWLRPQLRQRFEQMKLV